MVKRLKITILTNKTSWMNKYDLILKQKFEKLGHDVQIIHSKKDITQGDIAFFLSCFEIISEEFLKLNHNNIVVHASDLPQGKGWSPISWQILEGKNDITITLFEATNSVDAGDYYIKDILHLDGYELINQWQEKLGTKIIEMCLKYVKQYKTIEGIKQSGVETFYPRRTPSDSELDIDKTIREQFNVLRIVDNEKYPAFFRIGKKTYKIIISTFLNGGGVNPLRARILALLICCLFCARKEIFCV